MTHPATRQSTRTQRRGGVRVFTILAFKTSSLTMMETHTLFTLVNPSVYYPNMRTAHTSRCPRNALARL